MLTPRERQIVEFGKAHGQNRDQIIQALQRARSITPTTTQTAGNQFEQVAPVRDDITDRQERISGRVKGFVGKFIGGGKLAEGAGQALAAPEVQATLSKEESETRELQTKLLQAIRNAKAEGRDASRLEKALNTSKDLVTTLADAQQDFGESLATTKEVIGSAVRLGTTLAAGGITRAAAKATALRTATSFGAGALRGAGAGAIAGGVVGGLQGAGLGLEADKDAGGIAKEAAVGAGIGITLGGVLGAITGGISGSLRGRQLRKQDFVKEFVAPKQTTKEKVNALRQGRFKDAGVLKKATIQTNKRTADIARSVDDVVDAKASLGKNIDAIRLKVDRTDAGVKSYLQQNKVPFNTNQLRTRLNSASDELDLVFASDATAEKTYQKVVEAFMKNIEKKDTAGLFDARQTFDQLPAVKKLLNSQALGENAKKEIVLAVRKAANEYVASLLPKGNQFKALMLQQHLNLEALGNIAESNSDVIGKNGLQLLTEKYPILKWWIAGLAGGAGVGVGGAIIGSTD